MASKLIHLHSSTASLVPAPGELTIGQIAVNAADKKLFILDSGGAVASFIDASKTVQSVNSITPNTNGALTLTPTNLGATTVGNTLFTAASTGAVATYLDVIPNSQIGAASGVAPLDINSKVPIANLPDSILGGVIFQGIFTPGTSTLPAAANSNKGWYYIAASAGTYTPPGGSLLTFGQGDWIISDGTQWSIVDATDAVASVNGKTGVVVIVAGDITSGTFASAQLGATPGNNNVLTTDGSGNPAWAPTLSSSQEGASAAANRVLTTNGSNAPTWVATVPTINLPTATTSALGLAQAGTGLAVSSGVFSVDTTVLTLDEGTYTGT